MTREPGRAPPRHAHGDLTSLAPHERLPEILVVPRASGEPGVSGDFWGSQEGCQGPFEGINQNSESGEEAGRTPLTKCAHFSYTTGDYTIISSHI